LRRRTEGVEGVLQCELPQLGCLVVHVPAGQLKAEVRGADDRKLVLGAEYIQNQLVKALAVRLFSLFKMLLCSCGCESLVCLGLKSASSRRTRDTTSKSEELDSSLKLKTSLFLELTHTHSLSLSLCSLSLFSFSLSPLSL